MPRVNDLNPENWKDYPDLLTDSLWLVDERDKSGGHSNAYHGNFIPQIPNQLIRRFTRKGDVVLDPFVGHGTTLVEAKRLGRHGIGVDIQQSATRATRRSLARDDETPQTRRRGATPLSAVITADSASASAQKKVAAALEQTGREKLHLVLLHPPYHDIIRFSDKRGDLSNAESADAFAAAFGDVVVNFSSMLDTDRHLAVIIGDKYAGGEWIPLGFRLMQETLARDPSLKLKSLIVKNMANNRAKLNRENLWRYRALVGGFYIFKHEYIILFQKTARRARRTGNGAPPK